MMFEAELCFRLESVRRRRACDFFFQAEDGIRDHCVTGVQTCAFFIQAEDGIRDHCVTGVQTCALPISYFGSLEVRSPESGETYAITPIRGCTGVMDLGDKRIMEYRITAREIDRKSVV